MLCRKGEDVLVKATVVVAKIKVYLCLTRCVNLNIAYGVYMDRVSPFGQRAQLFTFAVGGFETRPKSRTVPANPLHYAGGIVPEA